MPPTGVTIAGGRSKNKKPVAIRKKIKRGAPEKLFILLTQRRLRGEIGVRAYKAQVGDIYRTYGQTIDKSKYGELLEKYQEALRGKSLGKPEKRNRRARATLKEKKAVQAALLPPEKSILDELLEGLTLPTAPTDGDVVDFLGQLATYVDKTVQEPDDAIRLRGSIEQGPFAIDYSFDPPTRLQLLAGFNQDDLGKRYHLEIAFDDDDKKPLKFEKLRQGPDIFNVPGDWDRFYALWQKIVEGGPLMYYVSTVKIRWVRIPELTKKGVYRSAEGNCAQQLLIKRFPAKANAISKIEVGDGGWGEKESKEASKILKRNIEIRTRTDHTIYRAGEYKQRNATDSVVIYDIDAHALGVAPKRPKKVTRLVLTDKNELDEYEDLAQSNGYGNGVLWPNGAALIVEQEHQEPLIIKNRELHESIERRATEIGFTGETALKQSVFSVEYERWREINRFEKLSVYKKQWRSANFWPMPYSAGLPVSEVEDGFDLNSAYESSPKNGADEYYMKYGFPSSKGQIAFSNPPTSILDKTGIVLASFDVEKCHPWIQVQLAGRKQIYITTMRLKSWLDRGVVTLDKLEEAIICEPNYASCMRPDGVNGRHWGRVAIGRLIAGRTLNYLYVEGICEATHIIDGLASDGRLGSIERISRKKHEQRLIDEAIEDAFKGLEAGELDIEEEDEDIIWKIGIADIDEEVVGAMPHIHAYYVDYTAIVLEDKIFGHKWGDIAKVKTDAIYLRKGVAAHFEDCEIGPRPGQWKREKYKPAPKYVYPEPKPLPRLSDLPKYWAPLLDKLHLIEGPAGYGKTYHCLENLAGHRHTILTPTRKMRRELIKKKSCDGRFVYTWKWAVMPKNEFDIEQIRLNTTIVYIPEIGSWQKDIVLQIIPVLLSLGHKIIADGDREQILPYKGESPMAWLQETYAYTWFGEKDWRSKDEATAKLKNSIRGLSNIDAMEVVIGSLGGMSNMEEFLDEWHPYDYVYITTHTTRDSFLPALSRVHREKYPELLVRIRYSHKDVARSGDEEYLPLGAKIPDTASIAYTGTYSACQGETAGKDSLRRRVRVWLVDDRFAMFPNAVYVGATRVEYKSQLGVVCIHED